MMNDVRRRLVAAASFALLLPLLLAGSGCARIAASSDVRIDGSMTRTVTYSGTSPVPEKPMAGGETASSDNPMSPRLEDLIVLPTAAGGWKITRTRDEKANVVITASRSAAAGQIIRNDLGIRLPKPKAAEGTVAAKPKPKVRTAQLIAPSALLLENTVTVRQIAPGRLEYREVLHWRGPRPKEMETPDPELLAALRRALPPSVSSDTAALKQVGVAMQRELWKVMFGPGEPMLPLLVFHQDLAQYRIERAMGGAVRRSLTSIYGSRLSADALRSAVGKLTAEVASNATRKTQAKKDAGPGGASGGSGDDSDSSPVALLIRVKMPGKVIETNGELDPETNEVIWPLYGQAAAIGDLTLTATTDVSTPK